MKRILYIAAMIATPATAQQTFGSSNCYITGSAVTCSGQSTTTPAPPQVPAYQQMMMQSQAQGANDAQFYGDLTARIIRAQNCKRAVKNQDSYAIEAYCH